MYEVDHASLDTTVCNEAANATYKLFFFDFMVSIKISLKRRIISSKVDVESPSA